MDNLWAWLVMVAAAINMYTLISRIRLNRRHRAEMRERNRLNA